MDKTVGPKIPGYVKYVLTGAKQGSVNTTGHIVVDTATSGTTNTTALAQTTQTAVESEASTLGVTNIVGKSKPNYIQFYEKHA